MYTDVQEKIRRLAAAAAAADELAAGDRESRDDAIEEAERAGLSVREIAQATAGYLSPSGVQQVILKRTAARQERLSRPI